jgi:glycosyltransferase involved in cell wall biosynthesis
MTVLTAALRVKNEAHNLPRCLANLERFCDHIVAYDDGSTDGTLDILRAHPLVRHVVSFEKDFYHETMDRSIALALATLTNPDWILRIDPDEEFEERAVRHVRELLEIPGFKAWALHRFNCVGDEDHGDLAEVHWCLFRYVPGKVFYYDIKLHHAFPSIDKIPGNWGQANLRVRHWGYVDKAGKVAKVRGQGYHFGDYLTPRFRWDEAPDSPLLYREVERPFYYFWSQDDADRADIDHKPDDRRFPHWQGVNLSLQIGFTMLQNLAPVEAAQALDEARVALAANPEPAQLLRLRLYDALMRYHHARWDQAEAELAAVRESCVGIWPLAVATVDYYLDRLAVLRQRPAEGFRDPQTAPYPRLRREYLKWFFQEFQQRQPPELYLFGVGRHTAELDKLGFFHHFEVKGLVDDQAAKRATLNGLPLMTLPEALARGARTLLISTDYFEPQILARLRRESLGETLIQPIYFTFGDQPFWFDERRRR